MTKTLCRRSCGRRQNQELPSVEVLLGIREQIRQEQQRRAEQPKE